MTKGMDHRSKLKCPEVRDTRMLIEALQAALGGNTVMPGGAHEQQKNDMIFIIRQEIEL